MLLAKDFVLGGVTMADFVIAFRKLWSLLAPL